MRATLLNGIAPVARYAADGAVSDVASITPGAASGRPSNEPIPPLDVFPSTPPSKARERKPRAPPSEADYWDGLIDEKAAAAFLGVTDRALQKWRQIGGGPPYTVLSSRCLRYRRVDLKAWADARIRRSTSDPGTARAEHAAMGE